MTCKTINSNKIHGDGAAGALRMDGGSSSVGLQIREPFTSNALHMEHNCIDLSQATLHLCPPVMNGKWNARSFDNR